MSKRRRTEDDLPPDLTPSSSDLSDRVSRLILEQPESIGLRPNKPKKAAPTKPEKKAHRKKMESHPIFRISVTSLDFTKPPTGFAFSIPYEEKRGQQCNDIAIFPTQYKQKEYYQLPFDTEFDYYYATRIDRNTWLVRGNGANGVIDTVKKGNSVSIHNELLCLSHASAAMRRMQSSKHPPPDIERRVKAITDACHTKYLL